MKITKKMLSLPPYLSTPWANVSSMHVKLDDGADHPVLSVKLSDGTAIEVPGLTQEVIDQIFLSHAEAIEEAGQPQALQSPPEPIMGLPIRIGAGGMDGFGGVLQHDPSQAEAPDLPPEILSKIAGVAQVLGAHDSDTLPQPEANCNCFHCQIARAIGAGAETNLEHAEDEDVTEEDLRFGPSWEIAQSEEGKEFYTVTNPLDKSERYTVYLGDPVGCTCGEKSCEHIQAVLKS